MVSTESASGSDCRASLISPLVESSSSPSAPGIDRSISPETVSAESSVRFPPKFAVISPEVVSKSTLPEHVTSSNAISPEIVLNFPRSAVIPDTLTSAEMESTPTSFNSIPSGSQTVSSLLSFTGVDLPDFANLTRSVSPST